MITHIRHPYGSSLIQVTSGLGGMSPIRPGSTFEVRSGVAYVVYNGGLSGPYGPGFHRLPVTESNFQLRFRAFRGGGDPGQALSILYVDTERTVTETVGLPSLIYNDKRFFDVSFQARAPVSVTYRIQDADALLKNIVGFSCAAVKNELLSYNLQSAISAPIRQRLVQEMRGLGPGEFNLHLEEISERLTAALRNPQGETRAAMARLGVQILSVTIQAFNIDKEEWKRITEWESTLYKPAVEAKGLKLAESIYNGYGGCTPEPVRRCPHCSQPYDPALRYCNHCGEFLT